MVLLTPIHRFNLRSDVVGVVGSMALCPLTPPPVPHVSLFPGSARGRTLGATTFGLSRLRCGRRLLPWYVSNGRCFEKVLAMALTPRDRLLQLLHQESRRHLSRLTLTHKPHDNLQAQPVAVTFP